MEKEIGPIIVSDKLYKVIFQHCGNPAATIKDIISDAIGDHAKNKKAVLAIIKRHRSISLGRLVNATRGLSRIGRELALKVLLDEMWIVAVENDHTTTYKIGAGVQERPVNNFGPRICVPEPGAQEPRPPCKPPWQT